MRLHSRIHKHPICEIRGSRFEVCPHESSPNSSRESVVLQRIYWNGMLLLREELRAVVLSLPLRRMRCASRRTFAFHGVDFGRGFARRGARPAARALKTQRGIRPGRRATSDGAPGVLCGALRVFKPVGVLATAPRLRTMQPSCICGIMFAWKTFSTGTMQHFSDLARSGR